MCNIFLLSLNNSRPGMKFRADTTAEETLAVFVQLDSLLQIHNHVEALHLVPLLSVLSVILPRAMEPGRNWFLAFF